MCSSDNITRRLPPPKSRTTLAASGRRNAKKQPTPVTTSSKIDPQKHAASRKAQSAQQDGRLRAAKPASTKAPPSDGVFPGHGGGKEEGHNDASGTILHRMLCIMQGMEVDIVSLKADVASLKNSNDQQAKVLVELRARNCQLERDNETFRVEVESTLEVIEDVVTRNSKKGHELEVRVEGYMGAVCDEFSGLDLRTVEPTHQTTSAGSKTPKKRGQMPEAFETLAPNRKSPLLSAASSRAYNNTTGSEATTLSISMPPGPSTLGQDGDDEDGTSTATPSPSTPWSASATFFPSRGDAEETQGSQGSSSDGPHSKAGEGEDGYATPTLQPNSSVPPLPLPVDKISVGRASTEFNHRVVVR